MREPPLFSSLCLKVLFSHSGLHFNFQTDDVLWQQQNVSKEPLMIAKLFVSLFCFVMQRFGLQNLQRKGLASSPRNLDRRFEVSFQ